VRQILIISGHPRSGTSILREVIDSHPHVVLTNEFGNFMIPDESYIEYTLFIVKRWWNRRNYPFILSQRNKLKGANMIGNFIFITKYLSYIYYYRNDCVNVKVIKDGLYRLFQGAKIVGDKHPDYIYKLDTLSGDETLSCIFIYRDVRDVVNSTLEKARNEYKNWWPEEFTVAGKVAKSWVNSIELMERVKKNINIIRYEDLVKNPSLISHQVGQWLNIDPSKMETNMVHTNSVGRHIYGLSTQELYDVINIAGPTMERLGYNI
jgi:hypothetical protein